MIERQTTLKERLVLDGVAMHSGRRARLYIHPAEAGSGQVFQRGDLEGARYAAGLWSNVCASELCTALRLDGAASLATIEHVAAALFGLGVDNALIEVIGSEAPIFDGSAQRIVAGVLEAGLRKQAAPRRWIEILKPVRVRRGDSFAELAPGGTGLRLDVEINFNHPAIGRQRLALDLTPQNFIRDLARARTFGFVADVERLWRKGLALGASLDNTIAFSENCVLNPEGLRFPDECVRHKMLDAVGDLALAGARLAGRFHSYCGGHALNNAVLRALFADRTAWALRSDFSRGAVRPDLGARLAPAFAPDKN